MKRQSTQNSGVKTKQNKTGFYPSTKATNKLVKTIRLMKSNKQKSHLKWSWESRRENSHAPYSKHTTDPHRKRRFLHL